MMLWMLGFDTFVLVADIGEGRGVQIIVKSRR